MKRRTKKRVLILVITLSALGLLAFAALYRGLTIARYEVSSDKFTSGDPIRVVLLTDLHSYIYEPGQEPLIRRVKELKPDVIFLSGDMADDRNPFQGMALLLEGISKLAPCYYVTGSHDYWSGDIEDIKSAIRGYGVTVLEGQTTVLTVKGQRLSISGIDDPVMANALPGENEDEAYRRALHSFDHLDRNEYNILAAHRPDFIAEYHALGFDMVLSGHTHGGQVRIPFLLNGLYAPNQGYFPRYAGGLYDVNGTYLLVSRGLSYYPDLPRIFNPPEVVLVELKGLQEDRS